MKKPTRTPKREDDTSKPERSNSRAAASARERETANLLGQVAAICKSQAVIEFELDGTILTANDNFLKPMGYTLEEVKGRHHSMFVDETQRHSFEYKEFWAKLGRGEYQSGEFKRIGKGGREVWIQGAYNPILDLHGRPFKVVKYATDVTQQKLQNADFVGQISAIGKSQAVIEFLLDGTILTANDNFLKAMGYTLEEVKGRHHSMFVDEAQRQSLGIQGVLGQTGPRRIPGRRVQASRQGWPRSLDPGFVQPHPRPQRPALQGGQVRHGCDRTGEACAQACTTLLQRVAETPRCWRVRRRN